ncbi:TetR family transcriptional regulator [Prescottella defluvii]|nr:TetR family transcriptional regulator [Prescottella defluvii]
MYAAQVDSSSAPTSGLRGITREAVRRRISQVAVDLFAERGFDSVTVEQIAAAVGISAEASIATSRPRKTRSSVT